MQQANGWRASGAAVGFRSEVKAPVTDSTWSGERTWWRHCCLGTGSSNLLLNPEAGGVCTPPAPRFPGLAVLPWTTIGIRASAVVMMVELRELVVLTAVAGHRLPNCWRDNDKCRGMAGSRFRLSRV
jgi:hypothetical protein